MVKVTNNNQNHDFILVKTAVSLDPKSKDEIEKILTTSLGYKLQIKNLVDKTLIAGIFLRVGDRVFDTTLKNKLEKIRERLSQ